MARGEKDGATPINAGREVEFERCRDALLGLEAANAGPRSSEAKSQRRLGDWLIKKPPRSARPYQEKPV